jgi:flagellar M-ring protein FliF
MPLSQLAAPSVPDQPTLVLPPRAPDESAQALGQLMTREPERVAAQVRQWMSED